MSNVPNLFIIGAPKSGTTSLYVTLKGHPQVFMSPIKEPNYFAPDLAHDVSGHSFVYPRDGGAYMRLFGRAKGEKVLGEASTRYMSSERAPELIKATSPRARIVAIVRNPVDMLSSLHAHKLAAGTEDIEDFEQALAADPERRSGRRIPARSNPRLATYRDRARYGEILVRWYETFGSENVRVLVIEDLVREPDAQFRALFEFLDVDPECRPSSFDQHNATHGGRRLVTRLSGTAPAQWLVWQALPQVVGDIRSRQIVGAISHSRLRRTSGKRHDVAPELRARLESEFESDVAVLSELLKRDLGKLWFGRTVEHQARDPLEIPATRLPLEVERIPS